MTLSLTPCDLPSDAVEMGRIADAWGIKGWIKVHAYSASADALLAGTEWFLQPPVAPFDRGFTAFKGTIRVEVKEIKPHADTLVALCDASPHRNAAESLKGARIFMSRSQFPQTSDPDEYYWVDLLGLRVVNREGVALGVVRDLMSTGPNSVLVIEYTVAAPVADLSGAGEPTAPVAASKQAERLIPFVAAYVDKVDKAAGVITVDWQEDYE
jgi:16S rRNA processing protein RimM